MLSPFVLSPGRIAPTSPTPISTASTTSRGSFWTTWAQARDWSIPVKNCANRPLGCRCLGVRKLLLIFGSSMFRTGEPGCCGCAPPLDRRNVNIGKVPLVKRI